MESRSLSRLRADVRFLGDVQSLTARHPDADLTARINIAIRALRGLVTANGAPYFIEATAAATLAGTQVTDEAYSVIPYPLTAVQIHGVDVESIAGNGDWRALNPVSWVQRRDYLGLTGGWPRFFAVITLPIGSGSSTTAGTIGIFPAAAAGQFKIWFIRDFTDLAADSDVFLGLPEWHDWVVWSVVQDLAARDDDQRETFQIATNKKAEAETRVVYGLGRVMSSGPLKPRRRGNRWGR